MAYVEQAVYAMLIRPLESGSSYAQTQILGFFAGHAPVSDVLNRSFSTLDPTYLSVISGQAAKERKFTLLKPQDDVTFMLLRSFFKKDKMKAALIFKTANAAFRLTITTEDATIHDIKENQSYDRGKADVVQFNIGSAIMLSEATLPKN